MNFERGRDPRESMGIGSEAMLKAVGVEIIHAEDFLDPIPQTIKEVTNGPPTNERYKEPIGKYYEAACVVVIIGEDLKIIKNPYWGLDNDWKVDEIPKLVKEIKDGDLGVKFPTMTQVAAKTVGMDLVPVKPMSKPIGKIFHLDYKYKVKNAVRKRKDRKGSPKYRKSV